MPLRAPLVHVRLVRGAHKRAPASADGEREGLEPGRLHRPRRGHLSELVGEIK